MEAEIVLGGGFIEKGGPPKRVVFSFSPKRRSSEKSVVLWSIGLSIFSEVLIFPGALVLQ